MLWAAQDEDPGVPPWLPACVRGMRREEAAEEGWERTSV